MIIHQNQTVTKTAGADLTECDGCFVTLNAAGKVVLTAASTAAAKVYGVLHTTGEADTPVTVALPGHAGLVQVATTTAVADGDYLVLSTNGKAKVATTGTAVAVATEAITAAGMVTARLINPTTLS